jgi:hypothetical protein
VPLTSNAKRRRLRLIRRCHRKRAGLPIRRVSFDRPRRSEEDEIEGRDMDTVNPELLGCTEEL